MSSPEIEELEVDFLILADFAQAVQGKLYLMGAAWDRKALQPEQPLDFGFAAGIIVPWTLTNREHKFTIAIETADGEKLGGSNVVSGGFTVGRSAKAIEGQTFRGLIAGHVQGPHTDVGTYSLVLNVGADLTKKAVFHVVKVL